MQRAKREKGDLQIFSESTIVEWKPSLSQINKEKGTATFLY